jgi:hypothetical protein
VSFTCPKCGTRDRWGTGTNDDRSKFYHCNGVLELPSGGKMSCDYNYPCPPAELVRTREQRTASLAELRRAHEQITAALSSVDPDDELGLRELEASYGQMQGGVVLLIDDVVSALGKVSPP